MGRICTLGFLLAVAVALTSCATGDPRLQGTWQSHKVPMPMEMVKVTTMQTVRVRKGSKRTKKVPRTVTVAKPKPAPPYIDLILKYRGSSLTMYMKDKNGQPIQRKVSYSVSAADEKSVEIAVKDPLTGEPQSIQILFEGPNKYWVEPADGQGWKEYYQRIETSNSR